MPLCWRPMVYKFKSKASGDLIMLQGDGQRLLKIIGKTEMRQGIIMPQDMPAAIAALQDAVAQETTARTMQAPDAAGQAPATGGQTISLRQRSLPFIQMLQRCMAEQKEITWGV